MGVLFQQGEGVELDIDLSEKGLPFVATGAVGLVIVLTVTNEQSGQLVEVAKYSFPSSPGYGKCEIQTASLARVYVTDAESRRFPTGVLQAHPTIRMPNTNFPDNVQQSKLDSPIAGRVERGHTLNQI